MCLSTPSTPDAPPPLPEAATLVDADQVKAQGKTKRRASQGLIGTILTGSKGVTQAPTGLIGKTILGG